MQWKALKNLQGHRWLRSTSGWVIRHTNSKTVSAWLTIDLLISLGLGVYFFFFRYVSSLGLNALSVMSSFKFYIFVAGFRAACSIWGILSVLFRNVRQVKLFYSIFILNLFVAVWLMIPILSLHCRCDNYYQCQALQSFALDGKALNKWPEPAHFEDRKVPYEEEPSTANELIDHPEIESTAKTTTASTTSTSESTTASEKKEPETVKQEDPGLRNQNLVAGVASTEAPKPAELAEVKATAPAPEGTNVQAAKDLAEQTQQAQQGQQGQQGQQALLQRGEMQASEELKKKVPHDHSDLSLEDLISMGHSRVVSKRRQRHRNVEASLLQIDSSSGADPEAPKAEKTEKTRKTEKTDEEQKEESKDAMEIRAEKELKVLTYFNPVGNNVKLVSEHGKEGQMCETKVKDVEMWKADLNRMDSMMDGKEAEEQDHSFIASIETCMAEEACAGIIWQIEQDEEGKHYKSWACTIIGPVSMPNKEMEELYDGSRRSLYFLKNNAVVKELVSGPQRKAKLISKIFDAKTDDELVEYTHRLYTNMCRCDEKSCRSYTQSQGSEMGWCYIDNKTRHLCTAAEKQVFLDSDDKPWSRSICHQAESYDLSCKCSGFGMLPGEGKTLDQDLLAENPYNYGSYCQRWNGEENKFKWCYVGWDSPCVDRRRANPHHKYKDASTFVPAQFWSEIACDADEPNKRLLGAADLCENLEYTADGVCILHLVLSVPMIMVLYNYISNQCGDDIQTVQQFAVESSSDDDEFPAGEGRKSTDSAANPAPAFEGAAESR